MRSKYTFISKIYNILYVYILYIYILKLYDILDVYISNEDIYI